MIDNHLLLNPAEAMFERDDPLWRFMRRSIRDIFFDCASKPEAPDRLIFTDALADDCEDRAWFDEYRELARKRGLPLVAVVLECELDENIRRLTSIGRSDQHKLTRPNVLRDMRARYQLLRPDGVHLIEIDVTQLDVDGVVERIIQNLPENLDH